MSNVDSIAQTPARWRRTVAAVRRGGSRRARPSRFSERRREQLWALLLLLPFLVGLVFFIVGPAIAALGLSFTSWDLIGSPEWVGLDNYKELIHDKVFWTSLLNTGYYTAVTVPVLVVGGLGLAVLMNRKLHGIMFLRAVYFAPVTVSVVAVSLLWAWLYSPDFGFLNYVLRSLHLPTSKWLSSPASAMPSVIIVGIWRSLGFNILIFLAALQAIPRDLYEAAEVDGASDRSRFWHVTLPMLSPTIFFSVVIGLITSFQVFEQTYIMTQGGPGNSTMTIIYDIFTQGFTYLRMGYASAISVVFTVLVLLVTIVQVKFQSRWVHYDA
jgi:multiple sugar transport system permease protein